MPNKKVGETKSDYIARCIPVVIDDGYPQEQAIAICESKWGAFDQIKVQEMLVGPDGIDAIALVDKPAIDINFLTFRTQTGVQMAKVDKSQRIICGPALVPNQMIYRLDEQQQPYYVYFSEATVAQIAQEYLVAHKQDATNLMHELAVDDVTLIESWLVVDPTNDKANAMGYKDLPKGTWMIAMKVNNEEVWTDFIKTETLKGFSIEGNFISKFVRQDDSETILRRLLKQGYHTVTWISSDSDYAKVDGCNALNNKQWALSDFLLGLEHEAPIFEKSHVQCQCRIRVTGDQVENLQSVVLDYRGLKFKCECAAHQAEVLAAIEALVRDDE